MGEAVDNGCAQDKAVQPSITLAYKLELHIFDMCW